MKVQELRQLLSGADRALMEKAFVECYKQFSKSKKEEDIDPLIQEILSGAEISREKKTSISDFNAFYAEVIEFLDNAYAQNYYAPNRFVPKSKRPKWRFIVKNYIKMLEPIQPSYEYYSEAVNLLMDIYNMLCYACSYYLFSTDDPFRSIGWAQPELYFLVVRKAFGAGYSREMISRMIQMAATGGISREALHMMQMRILVKELKTADVKNIAIEEGKKLIAGALSKQFQKKGNTYSDYYFNEGINNICGVILMLYIELSEPEEGIAYYFDHCRERDQEIVLYCALDLAKWMDAQNQLWLDIYKYALKRKIKPRESLVKEYQKRLLEISES